MEIVINIDNNPITINLNKNIIFFGNNSFYKTKVINTLTDCLMGKNKTILVNGKNYNKNDYNIININEETDLSSEFKFSKNNLLKQLIYDDIINKINEEKIIKYSNEIFDIIDDKVNKLLNRKVNKNSDNNLSLQIEIPDLNSIIDKFTNIYIDNMLLNDNSISKSMKRKLLYQLYFYDIRNNTDKTNIIIINNFDVYLSNNEIINLLDNINKLSSDNCYFILSSCNNIFEYIDINKYNIYKITDKIINYNIIDEAIKSYLLMREYHKDKANISFDEFYSDNESLISNEEIDNIRKLVYNKYSHFMSKILNSDNIKVSLTRPKNITCEYIICENNDIRELFLEIASVFVD